MSVETALPIEFSDAAAAKVKALVSEEENPDLKLRVYVTGGGCSGFQYGFTFDEKVNEGDMTIEKDTVTMRFCNVLPAQSNELKSTESVIRIPYSTKKSLLMKRCAC